MRRPAILLFGLVVLAAAWGGPLSELARVSFAAHMTLHMAVVAIAAPLIALGTSGGVLDPVPRAPRAFAPVPASVLELVVVWGWHAPALHHAARHTATGLALEQASFLACALFLWLAAFGGDAWDGGERTAAGVIGLLLTSMHMTLLGALLALAPRALFAAVHGEGWTTLEDQHLGGAVMLLVGGSAYLVGGLSLTRALLRRRRVEARPA